MNRRAWLSLFLASAGGAYGIWRKNRWGHPHSSLFLTYQKVLQAHSQSTPCLVIDLDKLDSNLAQAKRSLKPGTKFRVVVKSLPFTGLYTYVAQKMNTSRMMVFHAPDVEKLTRHTPYSLLLGKPMPVDFVKQFYQNNPPSAKIDWLIDTPQRLKEFATVSEAQNIRLSVNLEIDVGLHRGGFTAGSEWHEALAFLQKSTMRCSGLMGYDAHIPKLPGSQETHFLAMAQTYEGMKKDLFAYFPEQKEWVFNGGGSPTLTLHNHPNSPINDLSAGSFAVKPTDFELDTLTNFTPCAFIAAPILKKIDGSNLPGIESISSFWPTIDPARSETFFLYGGAWDADLLSPKGVRENPIYGKSTNQMMFTASKNIGITTGDFLFFRPWQSERTFTLFEEIIGVRNGKVEVIWT